MSRRIAVAGVFVVGLVRADAVRAQPDTRPDPCSGEPATEDETKEETAPAPEPPPPSAPPPPESKPTPPIETDASPEVVPVAPLVTPGFTFGSYGRLIVGTDLRGGSPEQIKVVAHPPRIVEPTYLELQLGYGFLSQRGDAIRTVTTLAFGDKLFHYTGEFDAQPAIRNLYAEAILRGGRVSFWAGSRMYRGDDIYLFDYWPLDDINTVGGGVKYAGDRVEIAAHAGANRLLNSFQSQTRQVANPEQGATIITQLDRQRLIASTTVTINGPTIESRAHLKAKVHGEVQGLPSGTRLRDDHTPESLPRDWGTTIGLQLGAWGFAPLDELDQHARHLNVFVRWSKGLAAYDELAPPTELDTSLATYPNASELVFGLSGAWDTDRWNVVVGAESRRFLGAGPRTNNPDDGWEYALDARPLVRAAGDFYAGVDLSFQARFPRGLNPTAQLAEDPAVTQIAPMIVYSPMGRHAYARPQIRLVYRAASLNQGALDLYVPDDPRHAHPWVHFLGLQAEWWFNSSYR
jgi:hypothetical protein